MKYLRIILQIIGAIATLCILAVAIYAGVLAWQYKDSPISIDPAKNESLIFILNWGGIDNKQKYSVVYGTSLPPTFHGDHVDYYCLQLENFNIDQTNKENWHAGPEENQLLSEAIQMAASAGKSSECFINGGVPNTESIQTYFWSTEIFGRRTTGTTLIMVEPSSKRLLYVSIAT